MKWILCITVIITPIVLQAKTIKIAIIDTGINVTRDYPIICKDGLIDFTNEGIKDTSPQTHGTNIAGIIAKGLKDSKIDYCAYIMKVYPTQGDINFYTLSLRAFKRALELKVDVINYSAAGADTSQPEQDVLKSLLASNIKVVVAAGNEGLNLDLNCGIYPACVPGVIAVGNLKDNGDKNDHSNTGKFEVWEIGTDVCAGKVCLTGTSQATAVRTVKIIKELDK